MEKKENKTFTVKSKAVFITSAIFFAIGSIIVYWCKYNEIMNWIRNCGLAFMVITLPIIMYFIKEYIERHIDEM